MKNKIRKYVSIDVVAHRRPLDCTQFGVRVVTDITGTYTKYNVLWDREVTETVRDTWWARLSDNGDVELMGRMAWFDSKDDAEHIAAFIREGGLEQHK